MVRGLGLGLPHAAAGDGRPRFCQGSALVDVERSLHPSQWAAAGLRMELRRRQSAGARVCRQDGVRHGEGPRRERRLELPFPGVQQAAAQLHVVGQPQRPRGQERLRRRLSRPRQHRHLRPQRAAADGRDARTSRWDGVDGVLRAEHARHRRRTRVGRSVVSRHGRQVRRTLHVDRDRRAAQDRRRRIDVGRGGRLLLRRPARAGRNCRPAQSSLARGPLADGGGHDVRPSLPGTRAAGARTLSAADATSTGNHAAAAVRGSARRGRQPHSHARR